MRVALCNRVGCIETVVERVLWVELPLYSEDWIVTNPRNKLVSEVGSYISRNWRSAVFGHCVILCP